MVTVVSRVTRLKGLEQFIDAASLLAPWFPTVRFVIAGEASAGDGDYVAALKQRAEHMGVGRRVLFTGHRFDVPAVLGSAAVSVMPSLNEALSNVLLESMAAGAPIVATRVGGTPEAIANGRTGLLVPADDPKALSEAIARLLQEPALAAALGCAARRAAESGFSLLEWLQQPNSCTGICWHKRERPCPYRTSPNQVDATRSIAYPASSCSRCRSVRQRPAVSIVIGRSVGFTAAFAIPIVLSRILDQAEFGTYKQLFLIYATLFGVAQLGIAESLYYFIPRDSGRAGQHIAHAGLTLAAAGITCLTLLMLFSDAIAGWLANPHIRRWSVAAGRVSERDAPDRPVRDRAGIERTLQRCGTHVCRLRSGAGGLRVYTGACDRDDCGRDVGFRDICPRPSCRDALGTSTGSRDGFRPQLSVWRGQLAYALPFALAVGVEIVQANFHQYVVATRFDAATFAIFAVGVLQMPLVDIIATSASSVMMVKISAGGDRDTRASLALWHDTIVRLSLVVFPLVAFMLIAARDLIVLVFTDAYAASVPIFQLSTVAILPACLCVDAVFRAHAQTRVLLVLNLVRLAAVALLIGGFLTAFGLRGAVAATLCATVLARALGLARIARLLNVQAHRVAAMEAADDDRRVRRRGGAASRMDSPPHAEHRARRAGDRGRGVRHITFMVLSLWNGSLSWFSMTPETQLAKAKRVL